MTQSRFRTIVVVLAVFLGSAAGAAEPFDAKRAAAAVDTALDTENKAQKLKSVDALLETYRKEADDGAKLFVLRLLNAKAELVARRDATAVLDEALALYAGAAPESLPGPVRLELAKARYAKVGRQSREDSEALLARIVRDESGAGDWRLRRLAFLAGLDLNGYEQDYDKKRARFRSLAAEIAADPDADEMRGALASAMTRLAEVALPDDKAALYGAVIQRFADDGDAEVGEWVMRAKWQTAALAEPADRFARLGEVAVEYKDSRRDYIQRGVGTIVRDMAILAGKEPGGAARFDAFALGLAGSAAAKRLAPALVVRAGLEPEARDRADRYRDIIDRYRESDIPSVRGDVLNAAEQLLKLSPDRPDVLALCEGLADEYAATPDDRPDSSIAELLSACADAAGASTEKVRLLDKILELGREGKIAGYRLEKVLRKRATLLGDFDSIARYYDSRYAAAPDDKTRCQLLFDKAGAALTRAERQAVYKTLIERFIDSRDVEVADKALDAVSRLPYATDKSELVRLYGTVERNFVGAATDGEKLLMARALVGKGNALQDASEKLAAFDAAARLAAEVPGRNAARLLERVVETKSRLTENPALLAALYRDRAAASANPADRADNLLLQAKNESNHSRKMQVYQAVIDEFGDATDTRFATLAAKAVAGKAEAAETRSESIALYREALARLMKVNARLYPWDAGCIVEKLVELIPGREGRIALYDELLAYYRGQKSGDFAGDISDVLLKKQALVAERSERMALVDEAVRLREGGTGDPRVYNLCEALLFKAELSEAPAEKAALYDRVLALTADADDYLARSSRVDALTGKAKALGDSTLLPNYVRGMLKLPATGEDVAFVGRLLNAIPDKATKMELCDAALALYQKQTKPDLSVELEDIRRTRGYAAGERPSPFFDVPARNAVPSADPVIRRRQELQAGIAAEPDTAKKIGLIDAAIAADKSDRTSPETYELLFLKATLMSDAAAKERVYDEILDRATLVSGRFSSLNWMQMAKAYQGKAALRSEVSAKIAVYDVAIRRYSGSLSHGATELVLELRLARLDVLESDAAAIVELKQILVDYLPYEDFFIKQKIPEVVEKLAARLAKQSGTTDREALRDLLKP